MHEVKLRGVDLNLLTVLGALLRSQSVTRAATELGMSQPAVSRALGRLRALLRDPLLARSPHGLVATPRARALAPRLHALLAEAGALITEAPFDPATLSAVMRVAATDHQTLLLLPRLMPRLAVAAPGLALRVVPMTGATIEELATGRLDLAFAVAQEAVPASLRQSALYRDRFATALRRGHPALADWSLARFCALDHILVSITGTGLGATDLALAGRGLSRRVALWLPHFHAALRMVAETDMTVTLPRSLAQDQAEALGLVLMEPPVATPPFTIVSLWPEVLDADPAHRWLRAQVAEAARTLPAVEPPLRPAGLEPATKPL